MDRTDILDRIPSRTDIINRVPSGKQLGHKTLRGIWKTLVYTRKSIRLICWLILLISIPLATHYALAYPYSTNVQQPTIANDTVDNHDLRTRPEHINFAATPYGIPINFSAGLLSIYGETNNGNETVAVTVLTLPNRPLFGEPTSGFLYIPVKQFLKHGATHHVAYDNITVTRTETVQIEGKNRTMRVYTIRNTGFGRTTETRFWFGKFQANETVVYVASQYAPAAEPRAERITRTALENVTVPKNRLPGD